MEKYRVPLMNNLNNLNIKAQIKTEIYRAQGHASPKAQEVYIYKDFRTKIKKLKTLKNI